MGVVTASSAFFRLVPQPALAYRIDTLARPPSDLELALLECGALFDIAAETNGILLDASDTRVRAVGADHIASSYRLHRKAIGLSLL